MKPPDVVDSKRHVLKYRGESYYFVVNEKELFISSVREKDQLTAAGIDTVTRLLSMCLQAYPKDKVVRQLFKASRSKKDLPGLIIQVLKEDL